MENTQDKRRLHELEEQLKKEEENYQNGIMQKKDYNTLRAIRNTIRSLQYELEQLQNGRLSN